MYASYILLLNSPHIVKAIDVPMTGFVTILSVSWLQLKFIILARGLFICYSLNKSACIISMATKHSALNTHLRSRRNSLCNASIVEFEEI